MSATVLSAKDHYVFFTYPAWGHSRALVPMAAKFIETRPAVVTILACQNFVALHEAELPKYFPDEANRDAIRIVSIDNDGEWASLPTLDNDYLETYRALYEAKPIKCAKSGVVHDSWPSPKAVVIDFFGYQAILGMRRISGHKVKIYSWESGSCTGALRICGPEATGGMGDFFGKVQAEAAATGRSPIELADEIFRRTDDSIIRIPGLPPMYDYEFHPQEVPFAKGISIIISFTYRSLMESDGVIINTSEAYEATALQAYRSWLSEKSIETFAFNFPPSPPLKKLPAEAQQIQDFLDTAESKHGKHSVVFVSFGTVYWTTQPEKIWAFFDVLIELGIPFIFAHASPFSSIPDEVVEKIKASGLGLTTPWAPQHLILGHQATGWFVTHGGHNGTLESLYNGVPLICWPFDADQPGNAANMTGPLDVAYELYNIRDGEHGLKPLARFGPSAKPLEGTPEAVAREAREIFVKARGDDGARKRTNARRIGEELKRGWDVNGTFTKEVNKLLTHATSSPVEQQ